MSQNYPLGSCFKWILCSSMLKASIDLSRILRLYVLLLHAPLGFHIEANSRLLKSLNS